MGLQFNNKKMVSRENICGDNILHTELLTFLFSNQNQPSPLVNQQIKSELRINNIYRQILVTLCSACFYLTIHKMIYLYTNTNILNRYKCNLKINFKLKVIYIYSGILNNLQNKITIGCSKTKSSKLVMLNNLVMKKHRHQKRKTVILLTEKYYINYDFSRTFCYKFILYSNIKMLDTPPDKKKLNSNKLAKSAEKNIISLFLTVTCTSIFTPIIATYKKSNETQKATSLDIAIQINGTFDALISAFTGLDLILELRLSKMLSSHKYELSFINLGSITWNKDLFLPNHFIFNIDNLSDNITIFLLLFFRSANQIIAQYYHFLLLQVGTYKSIQITCFKAILWPTNEIAQIRQFDIFNNEKKHLLAIYHTLKKCDGVFSLYHISGRMQDEPIITYPYPNYRKNAIIQRTMIHFGVSFDIRSIILKYFKHKVEYLKNVTKTALFTHYISSLTKNEQQLNYL